LPGEPGDRGRSAADNRRFVEAVLWIARTGAPRRDLPPEVGDGNRVDGRFRRWAARGVWDRVPALLHDDPDRESLAMASTVLRAHQHAAEAKKRGVDQALGRSRGGLSGKRRRRVDALGQRVRVVLAPGPMLRYEDPRES